jgi:DNA-directed RNA polymerase subunit RPC12/RpoP
MEQGPAALQWSPRLSRQKLRQLYNLDSQGILDEELLDDVGWCLLARCRDILTVHRAKRGKSVRCPACDGRGEETYLPRQGGFEELIRCPQCGWQIRWVDFLGAVKRRQLNAGGAVKAFADYVACFSSARSPQEKMLAIDQLIHAFHYSIRELPDLPTRPVGVNLIQGNLKAVIALLDELSFGENAGQERLAIRQGWEQELGKFEQIDWKVVTREREIRHNQENLPGKD